MFTFNIKHLIKIRDTNTCRYFHQSRFSLKKINWKLTIPIIIMVLGEVKQF